MFIPLIWAHVDKKMISKLWCRIVIQRDFNGLKKWTDRTHEVQEDKCKILHLPRYKSMHKCRLGTDCPKSAEEKRSGGNGGKPG